MSSPLVDREARRRLAPRLIDADWLVLRGMRAAIAAALAEAVRPGDRAIDLGCGRRPYEPLVTAAGATYRGADFESDAAEIRIDPGGKVEAGDGSAEIILSFQVLEHVADPQLYLAEARRLLAPEGRLILSTHGTWPYHPHPEDHRRWTRTGLVAELQRAGFEPMSCRSVVGPLAWTTIIRTLAVGRALKAIPLAGAPLAGALAMFGNLRASLEERLTPTQAREDNGCVYVTLSRVRAAA